MKTRRSGSRSIWPSNQCRRCLRTSGWSCSIACPVFFARDPVMHEEAMHCADPNRSAALDQPRLNLDQGHVSLFGDQLPNEATMRFNLARMPVTAARLGHGLTMLQGKSSPADRARHTDTEAGRRRTATQARLPVLVHRQPPHQSRNERQGNPRNQTSAKVVLEGSNRELSDRAATTRCGDSQALHGTIGRGDIHRIAVRREHNGRPHARFAVGTDTRGAQLR
jgi:hypothetical protein